MAFHPGPRTCMGANITMLETRLVMVHLLMRFQLQVLPDQDMTQEIGLTLAIKNGLRAKISVTLVKYCRVGVQYTKMATFVWGTR